MGLLARLIGTEQPNIAVHTWFPLFEQYKRSRVTLTTILDAFELTDKTEEISGVFTGTNKLGLSVSHTWADDDGVFFTTTGTLPSPFQADTLYFVRDSNPGAGTIKVATTKDGTPINITTEGTGTHTLNRAEADFVYFDETRASVTSTAGNADQKLRRIVWDLKSEGIAIVANQGIDHDSVADYKTELTQIASWLTVT